MNCCKTLQGHCKGLPFSFQANYDMFRIIKCVLMINILGLINFLHVSFDIHDILFSLKIHSAMIMYILLTLIDLEPILLHLLFGGVCMYAAFLLVVERSKVIINCLGYHFSFSSSTRLLSFIELMCSFFPQPSFSISVSLYFLHYFFKF